MKTALKKTLTRCFKRREDTCNLLYFLFLVENIAERIHQYLSQFYLLQKHFYFLIKREIVILTFYKKIKSVVVVETINHEGDKTAFSSWNKDIYSLNVCWLN